MAVPPNTTGALTPLPPALLKRRAMKFAASAAAVTLTSTLGGCAMFGMESSGPKPQYVLEPDSRPVTLAEPPAQTAAQTPAQQTPQQKQLAKQVEEFTASVDAALAAPHNPPTTPTSTQAVTPAPATPAAVVDTSGVILASTQTHAPETPKAPNVQKAAETPKTPEPAKTSSPIVATATPVSTQTLSSATISPLKTPTEKVTPTAMTAAVAVAAPVAPAETTAVASEAVIGEPAEPTLDQALAVLRKNLAAKPTLNTALALALIDSSQGKTPEAASTELSEADQKVLADLLGALTSMNTTTNGSIADRTAPLVSAAKKWEGEADLQLPKLLLASRVDSYGVYSAIDAKFDAGKRHTVIIYCEVANFSSKTDAEGWHQTRLSQQETLITEDGLLVWRPNAEEVEDRSLNQRRDFYLVKKLTIPENLAAGKYTLRMSVTDKHSGKIAMVNLPIEIVGR